MNEKTENYKIVNGELVWINPELKEFTIPEGVTDINLSTVKSSKIKRIVFSSTIRKVGAYAFNSFLALEEIELNEGLEVIEEGAFYGAKISTLTIMNPNIKFGDKPFDKCDYLNKISLPISFTKNRKINDILDGVSNINTINFNVREDDVVENLLSDNSLYLNLKNITFTFDNSKSIVDMIYSGNVFKIVDYIILKNKLRISFIPNSKTKRADEDEWYKALNEIYNKCYDAEEPHILFSLIIKYALKTTKERVENVKEQTYGGTISSDITINEQREKDILKFVIFEISKNISEKICVSDALLDIYYMYPEYRELTSKFNVDESLKELYGVFEIILSNVKLGMEFDYRQKCVELMNTICSMCTDKILFTDEESSSVLEKFIGDMADCINDMAKNIYLFRMQVVEKRRDVAKKRYLGNNK